eukprot:g5090.t1
MLFDKMNNSNFDTTVVAAKSNKAPCTFVIDETKEEKSNHPTFSLEKTKFLSVRQETLVSDWVKLEYTLSFAGDALPVKACSNDIVINATTIERNRSLEKVDETVIQCFCSDRTLRGTRKFIWIVLPNCEPGEPVHFTVPSAIAGKDCIIGTFPMPPRLPGCMPQEEVPLDLICCRRDVFVAELVNGFRMRLIDLIERGGKVNRIRVIANSEVFVVNFFLPPSLIQRNKNLNFSHPNKDEDLHMKMLFISTKLLRSKERSGKRNLKIDGDNFIHTPYGLGRRLTKLDEMKISSYSSPCSTSTVFVLTDWKLTYGKEVLLYIPHKEERNFGFHRFSSSQSNEGMLTTLSCTSRTTSKSLKRNILLSVPLMRLHIGNWKRKSIDFGDITLLFSIAENSKGIGEPTIDFLLVEAGRLYRLRYFVSDIIGVRKEKFNELQVNSPKYVKEKKSIDILLPALATCEEEVIISFLKAPKIEEEILGKYSELPLLNSSISTKWRATTTDFTLCNASKFSEVRMCISLQVTEKTIIDSLLETLKTNSMEKNN